jgi:hypothetical protein
MCVPSRFPISLEFVMLAVVMIARFGEFKAPKEAEAGRAQLIVVNYTSAARAALFEHP